LAIEHPYGKSDLIKELCSRISDASFAATRTISKDEDVIPNVSFAHLLALKPAGWYTVRRCEAIRVVLSFARIEGGGLDLAARCGTGETAAELMAEKLKISKMPAICTALCNDLAVLTERTISYRSTFPDLLRSALDFPGVLSTLIQKYALA
jgi:hypothetical protein